MEEEQRMEDKRMRTAVSWTSDPPEVVSEPCVPLALGHVSARPGFALCRPRDFISAMSSRSSSPTSSLPRVDLHSPGGQVSRVSPEKPYNPGSTPAAPQQGDCRADLPQDRLSGLGCVPRDGSLTCANPDRGSKRGYSSTNSLLDSGIHDAMSPAPHRGQEEEEGKRRKEKRERERLPWETAWLPSPSPSSSRPNLTHRPPSPCRAIPLSPPPPPVDGRSLDRRGRASFSAFSRSLAASCISQSISQSIAKKNAPPPLHRDHAPLPSPHLHQRPASPQAPPPLLPTSSTLGYGPYSSPPLLPSGLSYSSVHINHNNNNNNMHCRISMADVVVSHRNANRAGGSGSDWPASQRTLSLAHASAAAATQQSHDALWSAGHNRVARPFSASEPGSRVQSPSPFLCSPLPHSDSSSSPLANNPPQPRDPLGFSVEQASWTSSATGPASCSLRVLSPPPIGVSPNAWANHIAAPQPRNPCSSLTSQTQDSSFYAYSPSPSPPAPPPLPPSSLSLAGGESVLNSHTSAWSSYLQSPVSPSRLSPARATQAGRCDTSAPWPDVQEVLHYCYDQPQSPETEVTTTPFSSSPAPLSSSHLLPSYNSSPLEQEEGSCRSQLFCAYVARPSSTQTSHHPTHQSEVHSPLQTLARPPPGEPRTNYATTVNLKVAGSGRITFYSSARVSLNQNP